MSEEKKKKKKKKWQQAEAAVTGGEEGLQANPATDSKEKGERKKIIRRLAAAVWGVEYKLAHPEASKEDRQQAWTRDRQQAIKNARLVLKNLEKRGVTLSLADGSAGAEKDEPDDED